jgi:hypothetical protein
MNVLIFLIGIHRVSALDEMIRFAYLGFAEKVRNVNDMKRGT